MQTINLLTDLGLIGNTGLQDIIQQHNDINEISVSSLSEQLESSSEIDMNESIKAKAHSFNEDNLQQSKDELDPHPSIKLIADSDNVIVDHDILLNSADSRNYLIQYCLDNNIACKSKKITINLEYGSMSDAISQFVITMKAFGVTVDTISNAMPKVITDIEEGPTEELIESESEPLDNIEEELIEGPTEELIEEGPTEELIEEGPTESELEPLDNIEEELIEGPTEELIEEGPTESELESPDIDSVSTEDCVLGSDITDNLDDPNVTTENKQVHGKNYFVNYLHTNKGLSETKSHIAIKHIFDVITDLLIDKKGKLTIDDYTFYTMKPKGKRKRHVFCDITADISVSQDIDGNEQISGANNLVNKYTDSTVYVYHPSNEIYSAVDNILKVNGIRTDVTSLEVELPFMKASKNDVDISDLNGIQIMPKELFTYKGSDNRNMVGLRFMSTIGTKLIDKLQSNEINKFNEIDVMITVGKAFDFGIKDRFVQPRRVALQHQRAIQITKITKQEI